MGVYAFGFNAALLCVLGVAAAVLAEYGYQKMTRQRVRIGDFSAAVTGAAPVCGSGRGCWHSGCWS